MRRVMVRAGCGTICGTICPYRAAPDGGTVRALKGEHAGKLAYNDDDEGDRAVVYFGEPISSGYVLIKRGHLANVAGVEHERWKRAHPEFSAVRWWIR